MVSRPKPCVLDEFEDLGFVRGNRVWRNQTADRLYTWDALHGEVEVFDKRGRHIGVLDAMTGQLIKPAKKGRTIDV
jgi:hypothetical protein